jgi:hypothetical protein
MNRNCVALTVVAGFVGSSVVIARDTAEPTAAGMLQAPRIAACSLLPKAEVRTHLPWHDIVNNMPPEEEPAGAAGSSCNYPSVFIQIFPVGRLVRGVPSTEPGWQPVAGIGDEAWFRPNRTNYAELYVKTAKYTLTVQANADGNVEKVKPGTLSLAKALLAKLR